MVRAKSSSLRSVSDIAALPAPECIRLRGVRQNNLKGFDLDLPLGRYIVVTGPSGAGKSSLVFDTLHAEGQRRYVETFSAYTRQFLDLLDKPKVDAIENIRPSIAIEQTNTVKTSRSTVGTMTELTDYFKVWFSHIAACYDPATGLPVENDTPATIWEKASARHAGRTVVVAFRVKRPANFTWAEILASLKAQSYVRALTPDLAATRIDDLIADPSPLTAAAHLFVAQDRIAITPDSRLRFLEAAERALHHGQGELNLFAPAKGSSAFEAAGHYSRGLHSPETGRTFRPASPALFSFNSPLGACPRCRGFGRIIEIDTNLAIPDRSLSIADGAIKAWQGETYGESQKDLLRFAKKIGLPVNVPFADLSPAHQKLVLEGEPDYGQPGREWPHAWYGLKGFFQWLEKNTYKTHVRVFLSRFRAYNPCPDCRGARLQPDALCWKWRDRTLPELYQLPVSELFALIGDWSPDSSSASDLGRSAHLAFDSIRTRLRYLTQVGLGYLTLDRTSKTLSGGETMRVGLTSCLGTSLVDTLFVLDEPSVGLHPRDIDRLIEIIRTLTRAGNTVVVVEHDEAMIRAADHVIEIGPVPGAKGGHLVFQGDLPALLRDRASLTGSYLSGRKSIPTPASRRKVACASGSQAWLTFDHATKHNLRDITLRIPLHRFVALSGVSGSGKSTLLDKVVHQGLLAKRHQLTEDAAQIAAITGDDAFTEIVLVDQSPLSRTPRSNPALYVEAWDMIRELYAKTPAALAAGFSASSFSFNAGDGRCDHCQGLGYERVEMQFLSDVFVPCPVCEGRRFKPEILAITHQDKSVADLLNTSVSDALEHFAAQPAIRARLAVLDQVGLGYLTLGQPLNTLSGGEAQRLKLVKYLTGYTAASGSAAPGSVDVPVGPSGALLLLDEPTTGLHRHDVARLLQVLQTLVDRGHSLVVIEHNLDVLKSADWLIEVGPEAGAGGGRIVAEGTPEQVARTATATAPYLAEALALTQDTSADLLAAEPVAAPPSTTLHPAALRLEGARENNLKNISLTIPHRQLNVVTGVSGSGKSTLAFDIIFAEGQRRFMDSMSAYARQFVEQMPRPAIDRLTGIPPTVAIEQRITRGSRKSTVATITEVAQYLRLLYARLGVQHHPDTDRPVQPLSPAQLKNLLAKILATPAAQKARHLYLCAPLIRGRKGHHQPIATWIEDHGFELMRADGRVFPVAAFEKLDRYSEHDVEVVVADLKRKPDSGAEKPSAKSAKSTAKKKSSTAATLPSPAEALEQALQLGKGSCFLLTEKGETLSWFSTTRTDAETGESFPELDPKHFSHNSPRGWCPTCRGHGRVFPWMLIPDEDARNEDDPAARLRAFGIDSEEDVADAGTLCPDCEGQRLARIPRAVKLHFTGKHPPLSLPRLLTSTPSSLLHSLEQLDLDERGRAIVQDILPQIRERLRFLDHVGLGYLSLDRPTDTLSGGEAQRIRLAAQLGTNLAGVLYVLDEPSIGLHARDNDRLIETLQALRDKGNTLLVVEHDDDLMERCDRLIDLGPAAGIHGGEILAEGTPAEVKRIEKSLTGRYLSQGIKHPLRGAYRPVSEKSPRRAHPGNAEPQLGPPSAWLTLAGARLRNLKNFDVRIPLGRLTMVCGPSGAGKSTLFRDLLHPAVAHAIKSKSAKLTGKAYAKATESNVRNTNIGAEPPFAELRNAHGFKQVIEVDQSPIGKTPRSTPATYLGIFDLIRQFFASIPESKIRGYTAGRFSFNTAGGRCETCAGAGRVKLEMAFMPDTYLPCDDCRGTRYAPELADLTWKGKNIADVLALTFEEAVAYFDFHSQLSQVCQLMVDCGLGYLTLGQSSPTLSGGEAQRLKLVTELTHGLASYRERSRNIGFQNLYILEEPTIGLHLSDCEKLIRVLHALVDQGHTVVVIEHHLDLLAEADWIIELGPVGGPDGGKLLYLGELAGLLKSKHSPTAPYLQAKVKSSSPGAR
ncbi:MAG: excinuclease ABC subunit UvrA [Opitutaceae bacterium]|nr:excinuclease ABC subunit UvrA [Opitutaceae bacterium]